MTGSAAQPSEFHLREFVPADFEALWRLDQICFTRGIAYSKEELAYYIKQPRAFTIVAEKDNAIVAFIVVEQKKQTGRVITIDVHPDQRRSGLGTLLMRTAEDKVLKASGTGMVLEVAVDNSAAVRFYKRHGYSITKTIPRYYLGSLDALRMEKALSTTAKRTGSFPQT